MRQTSEVKWVTSINGGFGQAPNTWHITEISPNIAIGAGKDQRIGRKIRYKFVQINGHVKANTGTAAIENFAIVRVVIFFSRTANPLAGDIFDSGGTAPDFQFIHSTIRSDQVRVLSDHIYLLGKDSVADRVVLPSAKKIRLRRRTNQEVIFEPGSTFPSIPKDRLYIVVGMANAPTTATVDYQVFTRFSFIDM